jgi:hypothetical protein
MPLEDPIRRIWLEAEVSDADDMEDAKQLCQRDDDVGRRISVRHNEGDELDGGSRTGMK